MAQQMVELWTTFAANARPRALVKGMGNPLLWTPMKPGGLGPYIRINQKLTIEDYYPKEFVRNVLETHPDIDVTSFVAAFLS